MTIRHKHIFLNIMPFLLLFGCGSSTEFPADDFTRVKGKAFKVDPDSRQFELLKETAFDPQTNEGRSRFIVRWTPDTEFIRVERQNNFEGLEGQRMVLVKPHEKDTAKAAADGTPTIVTLEVTVFAEGEDLSDWSVQEGEILAPFTADPDAEKFSGGVLQFDGKSMPLRLRGPRARVDIRSKTTEDEIADGFWEVGLSGHVESEGKWVARRISLKKQPDPRAGDDPDLPRILVVGDSISMNYHRAAKEALEGIANYHRIDGNGGPSDRGVVCMELWLGDYTQEGMHWDVIQFNHGLHDLKQWYDEETGQYGTHMVPVDAYQKNLEREIRIMKKTGAKLVWCTTTPVPRDSVGRWKEGTMGRQQDEDLVYNRAARELMKRHPEIAINDINTFIRESDAFDEWRKQNDVHFWDRKLQEKVGQAVAEGLKEVIRDLHDSP
jgi:hypothetical protein